MTSPTGAVAVIVVMAASGLAASVKRPAPVAIPQPPSASLFSAIATPESAMADGRSLFDGTSLSAWRGYKTTTVPDGWKIENGALTKDGHVGDLITRDQFGDFELELEWRIGRGG